MTAPVLLKVKVMSCASPFLTASRLFGRTAEALPAPPMTSEPWAGTVSAPLPLAGLSSADLPVPSRVMESSVCGSSSALKTVAETTAGPVDSRSGWVITTTFCSLISPTWAAALSGLISRVWESFPAPQAASEAIENAMAEAARAPRRRLLLTAAATP